MRKAINFLIAATSLAVVYFLLKNYFPKYAGLLPFFLVTVLLDLYLWYSVKKAVASAKPLTRWLMTGFFWLPLILMILFIMAGFFRPFIYWNIFLRTYGLAIIAIVYFCKLFPIFFLASPTLSECHFLSTGLFLRKSYRGLRAARMREPTKIVNLLRLREGSR